MHESSISKFMKMFGCATVDVVVFLFVTTTLTLALLLSSTCSWLCIMVMGAIPIYLSQSVQKVDKNWFNWFEVTKLITIMVGFAYMNHNRSRWNTSDARWMAHFLLYVNILEAVFSDIQRRCIPNALAGLFLLVPLVLDVTTTESVDAITMSRLSAESVFYFPLPKAAWNWIFAYTSWNFSFTYAFGFAHNTRLILITSIVVCFLQNTHLVWVYARCASLLINCMLRSTRLLRPYKPGQSFFTHLVPPVESRRLAVAQVWGSANLIWTIYLTKSLLCAQ